MRSEMALEKRGEYRYGDGQADIREELARYGKLNGYLTHHFADAVCVCGGRRFHLQLDDTEGAAGARTISRMRAFNASEDRLLRPDRSADYGVMQRRYLAISDAATRARSVAHVRTRSAET
jgi:hypothetical protein